jgi:integrase/recombinase XerD
MAKAKTLTDKDLKKVLNYIAVNNHAARNRAMLLCTAYAGLRVKEVAALKIADVIDVDVGIKTEVRLTANQTKGDTARTVFFPEKLRRELLSYIACIDRSNTSKPLFASQKSRTGFTANTLCQHFHYMYKNAGVTGGSSHSGRRTFLTNLANKGIGVRVLMSLAGHKNIGTTQAYLDVNDEQLRKAVELI